MNTEKLTVDQFNALITFANRNGRQWKSLLNAAWMDGCYGCDRDNAHLLQQIRNQHGPSWLVRFNLKKAQAQYAAGLWAPYNG